MGRKTSVYLSNSQLLRLSAIGEPSTSEVLEQGIAALERAARESDRLRLQASRPLDAVPWQDPDSCPHPMGRRDQKSGLCNACGTNVG